MPGKNKFVKRGTAIETERDDPEGEEISYQCWHGRKEVYVIKGTTTKTTVDDPHAEKITRNKLKNRKEIYVIAGTATKTEKNHPQAELITSAALRKRKYVYAVKGTIIKTTEIDPYAEKITSNRLSYRKNKENISKPKEAFLADFEEKNSETNSMLAQQAKEISERAVNNLSTFILRLDVSFGELKNNIPPATRNPTLKILEEDVARIKQEANTTISTIASSANLLKQFSPQELENFISVIQNAETSFAEKYAKTMQAIKDFAQQHRTESTVIDEVADVKKTARATLHNILSQCGTRFDAETNRDGQILLQWLNDNKIPLEGNLGGQLIRADNAIKQIMQRYRIELIQLLQSFETASGDTDTILNDHLVRLQQVDTAGRTQIVNILQSIVTQVILAQQLATGNENSPETSHIPVNQEATLSPEDLMPSVEHPYEAANDGIFSVDDQSVDFSAFDLPYFNPEEHEFSFDINPTEISPPSSPQYANHGITFFGFDPPDDKKNDDDFPDEPDIFSRPG